MPQIDHSATVAQIVTAPLVDLAREKGFLSFSVVENDGLVRTYLRKDETVAARP